MGIVSIFTFTHLLVFTPHALLYIIALGATPPKLAVYSILHIFLSSFPPSLFLFCARALRQSISLSLSPASGSFGIYLTYLYPPPGQFSASTRFQTPSSFYKAKDPGIAKTQTSCRDPDITSWFHSSASSHVRTRPLLLYFASLAILHIAIASQPLLLNFEPSKLSRSN